MTTRRLIFIAIFAWLALATGAQAHPMGNFSVSHFTELRPRGDELYLIRIKITPRARDRDIDRPTR
jgi:hypothetical protein